MPAKPALIAAGIAGTLALGAGGYFANERRVCRTLEADYLEEMTAVGTDLQSGAVMQGMVDERQLGARVAAGMEKANRIYSRIRSQCGDAAALSIQQKGIDLAESIRER